MAALVSDRDVRGGLRGPRPPDISPSALVAGAVIFYGLMAVAGWVALALCDMDPMSTLFGSGDNTANTLSGSLPSVLLGTGSGLAIVLLTRLTRNLGPMRRMQREFASVLGPLAPGAITVLALTSAIGEEALFRGALQPLLGFWPTVIIFGLLHGGGVPRLWLWTTFALLAGLLLGWMAEATGHLLAPVLCHFTVNFWNLHALAGSPTEDPDCSAPDSHPRDDDEPDEDPR